MRRARAASFCLGALAFACHACSLTTSLEGLTGGLAPPGSNADSGADAPDRDATSLPALSCDALKRASPSTPDGFQTIDPDGASGPIAPFVAWCDMTRDEGGWMLVSPALVGDETNVQATVTRDTDARGGLILRVYANSQGCGGALPQSRDRFVIRDWPPWWRVRLSQSFAGRASCWYIWGGQDQTVPLPPNLLPFDPTVDVIRDALRMGGANGDAFDGVPARCDNAVANFWRQGVGMIRSATVIVRRNDPILPSGLATGVSCDDVAPGVTSPLYWEYRDIYIK